MSRTDAHNPVWVRIARGDLDAEPQHADNHAVCDLPPRPPFTPWRRGMTACHWAFRYTGTHICSCWMCHAGPQHRQETRGARRQDAADLRGALRRWNLGDDSDIDDLAPPRRPQFW